MGPKKESWEYAGDADVKTWHTWKEKSNNQADGGGSADGFDDSMFDYNENAIPKTQVFPDTTYQENPKKD